MAKKVRFNLSLLFFIPLFLGLFKTSDLFALTLFVGKLPAQYKTIEVAPGTKLSELRTIVAKLGFDPDSLVYSGLKSKPIKSLSAEVTLEDLNVHNETWFSATLLPVEEGKGPLDPLLKLRETFMQVVYGDDDDAAAMTKLLKTFIDQDAAMRFVSTCKAGDDDGGKNSLFLAARKGNLGIIAVIRKSVGEKHFNVLIHEETLQRRTVLHAAARAVKNAPAVIHYVLEAAPTLINKGNEFGCTAFDAAIMYGLLEPARLAALAGLPSERDAKYPSIKHQVSSGCTPMKL